MKNNFSYRLIDKLVNRVSVTRHAQSRSGASAAAVRTLRFEIKKNSNIDKPVPRTFERCAISN